MTKAALRLDEVIARREMFVAAVDTEVRGEMAAAALHCDWLVVSPATSIVLDSAAAWSGAVWRIGRSAIGLLLQSDAIGAAEALSAGLVDAVAGDPEGAARQWVGERSELGLDVAAALIRSRGGDALERTAFAWLFSTGVPQEGLDAFLGKRRPRY